MTANDIVNQALSRIGSELCVDYLTDTTKQGVQARLHYANTRDALLRSHFWNFAVKRAVLVTLAGTPPAPWTYQWSKPSDCLRIINVDGCNSYQLEGSTVYTFSSTATLKYVAQITDVTAYDSLFVQVFALALAVELVYPLAGVGSSALRQTIQSELQDQLSKARIVNMDETNFYRQHGTWIQTRYGWISGVEQP